MVIEIHGTGTTNKGAQLMLEAIVERLGHKTSLASPPHNTDFFVRGALGVYQTAYIRKFPALTAKATNLLPKRFRRWYGLVAEREITGVVDAAGFQYADAFDMNTIKWEAKFAEYRKSRGVPFVMLPQAFGPFEDPDKAKWTKELLECASQVYVRDSVSAGFLDTLNPDTSIRLCPDFTIGLDAAEIERINPNPFVAIVPNMKLITTGKHTERAYLDRLTQFGRAAMANGLDVVIVVHETGDAKLSQRLAESLNATIYTSEKPRELKAALGQANLVISSRFHAVAGGLSQGVPTIALGWSHKYKELLADFGVGHWLATDDIEPQSFVTEVLQDSAGQRNQKENKPILLEKVNSMWAETESILHIGGTNG